MKSSKVEQTMHDEIKSIMPNAYEQPGRALSTWDGEGGAGPLGPQEEPANDAAERDGSLHVDIVNLRVRLVALENLVIALLSSASDQQNERVLEMAASMSRGSDAIVNPLMQQSAVRMVGIVERARHFRS